MQRRKITKRQLPTFTEQMMLLHAPEAQRLFWKGLIEGLSRGDTKTMEMMADIFKLIQRGGGISITQQILNNQTAAGETAPVVGFDAFVRQLTEARTGHALPAPEVIDVEVRSADTQAVA